ncbi:MAG TPA: hypothetical protein VF941_01350 [Clostridia bacterium]
MRRKIRFFTAVLLEKCYAIEVLMDEDGYYDKIGLGIQELL